MKFYESMINEQNNLFINNRNEEHDTIKLHTQTRLNFGLKQRSDLVTLSITQSQLRRRSYSYVSKACCPFNESS